MAMTRCTGRSCRHHARQILLMAARTSKLFMRTSQWECRNSAVIEHPCLPADRTVTTGACVTQRTAVIVVFSMTVHAVFTGVMESRRRMTVRTFGLCVNTNQRKCTNTMIEQHVLAPRNLTVAVSAVGTELVLMRVRRMTSGAVTRQCGGHCLEMAIRTLSAGMRARQRKPRLRKMIEAGIDPRCLRVTRTAVFTEQTVMYILFCMTADAGLRKRRRQI